MNKKNSQQVAIYAKQFLKSMRSSKSRKLDANSFQQIVQKQPLFQQEQKQHMQIQMGSCSQMEAEELFQNLDPYTPQVQPKQIMIKQKIKQKEEKLKKRIGIQKQKIRIDIKQKKKMGSKQSEQIKSTEDKVIKTKSILMSGKQKQNVEQADKPQSKEEFKVTKKSVTFYLPVSSQIQKKWKDPIQNQKKGKFDAEQSKILTEAVGKFIVLNDLTFDQFEKTMSSEQKSDKFSRKQKIFSLLSTVLPNRSAQSCYKYVKRNFNSLNRKGNWTQQQVQQLKYLVQKYGRKWTIIAKHLKRTNDNVYDKFRSLGQQNMEERSKDMWKIRQLIQFLKIIQKMTKIRFIDHKIDQQLEREQYHDLREKQQITERKYNSKNFIFHNIQVVKPYINAKNYQKIRVQDLRCNQISALIRTKSILDCRNKFIQLLQVFFYTTPKQFDEQINKASSINQVNWKNWKSKHGSVQEAKNRFMIMKKLIQGRSIRSFGEIVQQMKIRINKKKNQS